MRPGYIALIFWGLAACAVFGIVKSYRTGIAHGEFATFRRGQEPVRFMMVILGRVFFIVLAIAETLYALGLAGDPIAALRSYIPFST
jgi:hypothetical protein